MKRRLVSKGWRARIGLLGKLVTALVLTVMMFLTIGVVQVKDSRKNASYCASCHDDYYDTWESDGDSYSLAHQHAEVSISCQTCHDRTLEESLTEIHLQSTGNIYQPSSETNVSEQLCINCHGNLEESAEDTSELVTGEVINPHEGHSDLSMAVDMSCTACHNMHSDSMDSCMVCHVLEPKPGWTMPDQPAPSMMDY